MSSMHRVLLQPCCSILASCSKSWHFVLKRRFINGSKRFVSTTTANWNQNSISPLVEGDLQAESIEAAARSYAELLQCSFAFGVLQPNRPHSVLLLQPRIDPPFGYQTGINRNEIRAQNPVAGYDLYVKNETDARLQAAEAKALVATLPGWSIAHSVLVPTRFGTKKKLIWGGGKVAELTTLAESLPTLVSAVFINVDQLSALQIGGLMGVFGGRPVFDRYTIVLAIFKLFGTTPEAQLQTQLAEIPYLRQSLRVGHKKLARKSVGGAAADWSKQKLILDERQKILEAKIEAVKSERLKSLKVKGDVKEKGLKSEPLVAIVGYTNAGKTSLIQRLTGDQKLARPMNRLFATMHVHKYRLRLPNAIEVWLADTVGFVSGLPAALFPAFHATLDHVRFAVGLGFDGVKFSQDCIVHVRDCSHPNLAKQTSLVESTLKKLLQNSGDTRILTVDNKFDLVTDYSAPNDIIAISCQTGWNLDKVLAAIQEIVTQKCDLLRRTFKVPSDKCDVYLNFLYKYASVEKVRPYVFQNCVDSRFLLITSVIDKAALDKFTFEFGCFEKVQ